MKKNKKRAIALISGGLDSLLAAQVIKEQCVYVEGIHFWIGFSGTSTAQETSKTLGIKLHIIDVVDEFKTVMLQPKYGYGAHLNPCLDCKIFMVKKAYEWMKKLGFDFVVTGEVIGQRPKSQRGDKLPIVAKESGAGDLLLRPLSAKLLPLTLPEKEGWIDRETLYEFSGRSRKPQMALVQKFGIQHYQQPGGGCLLTEPKFCDRMIAIWDFRGHRDYTKKDIKLLKIGRHLRPKADLRIIVGRDQKENELLETYSDPYKMLKTISHPGPVVLFEGEDVELAAQIAARFSAKGRTAKLVEFEFKDLKGNIKKVQIKPVFTESLPSNWYI